MEKQTTLKKNRDFKRLYARGKVLKHRALVVYCLKNHKGEKRYGITTSKKIGCAVTRNRARRIIREGYLTVVSELPSGYDFVFVARTACTPMKSTDIGRILRRLFTDAGFLEKRA